jgi:hypothetical protein
MDSARSPAESGGTRSSRVSGLFDVEEFGLPALGFDVMCSMSRERNVAREIVATLSQQLAEEFGRDPIF